ncbi:MAG TPA: hypothetical protein VI795_02345 [Patescibacteria group bacterium]|nr:hypothetical protein [Patescibacteria group bacterium]
MICYINQSQATGDYKVYKQDGSEVCIATFPTRKEAEKFIEEIENKN